MRVFMFALPAAPLLLAWFMVLSWAAVTGGTRPRPEWTPFPTPESKICDVCGSEQGDAVKDSSPARAT
jgi:hypothetical protein